MNRLTRAFTLVELMIVIMIVAVLAAVLFPVFAQAKLAAKQTTDLSNVRQLTFGMLLYACDHDDHSVISDHETGYEWHEALGPYLKSQDVLRSPAHTDRSSSGPESDYLINGLFAHGLPYTMFSEPAQQITIGLRHPEYDDIDYHSWPSDGSSWSQFPLYEEGGEDKFLEALFKRPFAVGANYGFADGHARNLAWTRTVQDASPGLHNVDQIVPAE